MQGQSKPFESHRRISRVDTAKLIRAKLEAEFPGVRFSVRCSRGGATDIRWADGPTCWQVQDAVSEYQSEGFDGMTDCRYSTDAGELLANPDGTVERVRYSSGLILEQRSISQERWRKLYAEIREFVAAPDCVPATTPVDASASSYSRRLGAGLARDPGSHHNINDLAHQLGYARDFSRPCDHEETYGCGNGWHRCRYCGLRTRLARVAAR